MAVTAEDQFEISSTPVLLMGVSTNYELTLVSGLDMPAIRTADLALVGNGSYAARDSVGPRTISLDVEIWGSAGSGLMTNATAFLTAWQSNNVDVKLTWRLFGQTANRYAYGRPRRCALKWDQVAELGFLPAFVDFYCQDPRIFLAADDSVVVF